MLMMTMMMNELPLTWRVQCVKKNTLP